MSEGRDSNSNSMTFLDLFCYFSFMESFVFEQQVLFWVIILSMPSEKVVSHPYVLARGQTLGHLYTLTIFENATVYIITGFHEIQMTTHIQLLNC